MNGGIMERVRAGVAAVCIFVGLAANVWVSADLARERAELARTRASLKRILQGAGDCVGVGLAWAR